jgi:hypothetical protein
VSSTENFLRQHDELMALGFEINQRLDPRALAADAAEVRRLVARFGGKLLMHAEMEKALYPRLLQHRDEAIRTKAQALYDEVKRVYDAFGDYAKRWPTAEAISADPAAFVRDTRGVLKMLGKRMMRENTELYPLADAAE